MIGTIVAFVAGLIFAVGLALAGMTMPSKVVAFLDVTGAWDPSLALVMVSAIGVYLPVHLLVRRRRRPLVGARFALPPETPIDGRLVGGAAVFGVGWGLSGFCPGPAIVAVGAAGGGAILFVLGLCGALVAYEAVRALVAARRRSAVTG